MKKTLRCATIACMKGLWYILQKEMKLSQTTVNCMESLVSFSKAPSCYLKLLHKLQKQICRTVGLSFAAYLELFAHHQNVASLSFFYTHYFGRCLSELGQLVPLPYTHWELLIILIDCMILLSPLFLDVTRMSTFLSSHCPDSEILCL